MTSSIHYVTKVQTIRYKKIADWMDKQFNMDKIWAYIDKHKNESLNYIKKN